MNCVYKFSVWNWKKVLSWSATLSSLWDFTADRHFTRYAGQHIFSKDSPNTNFYVGVVYHNPLWHLSIFGKLRGRFHQFDFSLATSIAESIKFQTRTDGPKLNWLLSIDELLLVNDSKMFDLENPWLIMIIPKSEPPLVKEILFYY